MTTRPFDPKLFDVRTLERNIKQGLLSREQVRAHLEALAQVRHKAVTLGQIEDRRRERSETERSARKGPAAVPSAAATAPTAPVALAAAESGFQTRSPAADSGARLREARFGLASSAQPGPTSRLEDSPARVAVPRSPPPSTSWPEPLGAQPSSTLPGEPASSSSPPRHGGGGGGAEP